MRPRGESRAAKVIPGDDALTDIDRVGRQIEKRVIFDRYALRGGDPVIYFSRQLGTLERAVFNGRVAGGRRLGDRPIARRPGECAVFNGYIVGVDPHGRRAEVDSAQNSAVLSDQDHVFGGLVNVRSPLGILRDLGVIREGRRRIGIAGRRIDPRQDGAGVGVADQLNLSAADHAAVPRSGPG